MNLENHMVIGEKGEYKHAPDYKDDNKEDGDSEDVVACSYCMSEGIVYEPLDPEDESNSDFIQCPVCKGSGQVPSDEVEDDF